jgi:hypothetical protein
MILGVNTAATSSTPLSLSIAPDFFFEAVTTNTGATVGTAVATITGGVAPYTINWLSDTIALKATTVTSLTPTFTWTALSVGSSRSADITVTVIDSAANTVDLVYSVSIERIS